MQAAHSVEQERQASEEPVLDGAVELDQAVMRDEWPSPALESVPTVAGETASADAVAQDAAPRRISAREAAELKLTPVDWTALDGKPWQGSRRTVRETQQGVSQVAVPHLRRQARAGDGHLASMVDQSVEQLRPHTHRNLRDALLGFPYCAT